MHASLMRSVTPLMLDPSAWSSAAFAYADNARVRKQWQLSLVCVTIIAM